MPEHGRIRQWKDSITMVVSLIRIRRRLHRSECALPQRETANKQT